MSRLRIGSSEAAAICGLSKYRTPYDVWEYKKNPEAKFSGNENTESGELLEPVILNWFIKKTGFKSLNINKRFEKEIFIGIADDIVTDGKNNFILEAKNTTKDIDENDLPIEWLYEVQMQMGLSGIHDCYIAYLSKGYHFGFVRVFFDEDMYNDLIKFLSDWYEYYIILDNIPDPISVNEIIQRIPTEAKAIDIDDNMAELLAKLRDVKQSIKELSDVENELSEKIKVFVKECDTITYKGKIVATWKNNKPSEKLDVNEFKNSYPDIYNQFIKEIPGARVFRFKNN